MHAHESSTAAATSHNTKEYTPAFFWPVYLMSSLHSCDWSKRTTGGHLLSTGWFCKTEIDVHFLMLCCWLLLVVGFWVGAFLVARSSRHLIRVNTAVCTICEYRIISSIFNLRIPMCIKIVCAGCHSPIREVGVCVAINDWWYRDRLGREYNVVSSRRLTLFCVQCRFC